MPKTAPDRRRQILDAALACFLARGYLATSMSDIRQRSGASTGSIYHFFAGKAGLAEALLREAIAGWSERTALPGQSAEADIKASVRGLALWGLAHPDQARFLDELRGLAMIDPELAAIRALLTEGHAAAAAQVLQPGDLVRLRIWREPDLSGDFLVGTDGVVVFPLIGPRQVMDRSPDALKVELVEAYAEYLRNPSIEVLPLRRVNIYGAVQQAGLYPVDPTMTLYDALALAGGPTTNGDPDKFELVRDGERVKAKLARDTRIDELPIRSGDQLFVPERSWFSRNTGLVATMISATVSLIIAFGR